MSHKQILWLLLTNIPWESGDPAENFWRRIFPVRDEISTKARRKQRSTFQIFNILFKHLINLIPVIQGQNVHRSDVPTWQKAIFLSYKANCRLHPCLTNKCEWQTKNISEWVTDVETSSKRKIAHKKVLLKGGFTKYISIGICCP